MKAYGVKYEQIDLVNDDFDEEKIVARLKAKDVRLVEIQRSRGYAHRLSLSIAKIERIIKKIREVNQDVIIMVDNCYGELVEKLEPGHVGADVVVGSLMKTLEAVLRQRAAISQERKNVLNRQLTDYLHRGLEKKSVQHSV